MTNFENEMLQRLLLMKEKELTELLNDDKRTIAECTIKRAISDCRKIQMTIGFIDDLKYTEF